VSRPSGGAAAVLGAGSIGVSFALRFACGGADVRLWDPLPGAIERASTELAERAAATALACDAVQARVRFTASLADAVAGAALIQECAPERLEVKRELLADVVPGAHPDAVIASSSSAIVPSLQAAELPGQAAARFLVAHPANPPHLLPLIELVPGERTSADTVGRARAWYRGVGLRPVIVRREIEGFIYNRLQGAVLREAYCLVRDGVAGVDDIDEVMRGALGRRWSVVGPFETVDLNTRGGIASHAAKMGPAYQRMGEERGQHDPWTPELVAVVAAGRRELLPLDAWEDRVRWRDQRLAELTELWDAAPPGEPGDREPAGR
jgi:3-hydroxyacyl-CoA dehydrogenase